MKAIDRSISWMGRGVAMSAIALTPGARLKGDVWLIVDHAITGNLRRSTDVSRSLLEKTRGDLAVARVSQDLHDALERHARNIRGQG